MFWLAPLPIRVVFASGRIEPSALHSRLMREALVAGGKLAHVSFLHLIEEPELGRVAALVGCTVQAIPVPRDWFGDAAWHLTTHLVLAALRPHLVLAGEGADMLAAQIAELARYGRRVPSLER